jgi:hypothetical protein
MISYRFCTYIYVYIGGGIAQYTKWLGYKSRRQRNRDWMQGGIRDSFILHNIQIVCEAHPVFYTTVLEAAYRRLRARGAKMVELYFHSLIRLHGLVSN